jgi:hypothetical protein
VSSSQVDCDAACCSPTRLDSADTITTAANRSATVPTVAVRSPAATSTAPAVSSSVHACGTRRLRPLGNTTSRSIPPCLRRHRRSTATASPSNGSLRRVTLTMLVTASPPRARPRPRGDHPRSAPREPPARRQRRPNMSQRHEDRSERPRRCSPRPAEPGVPHASTASAHPPKPPTPPASRSRPSTRRESHGKARHSSENRHGPATNGGRSAARRPPGKSTSPSPTHEAPPSGHRST